MWTNNTIYAKQIVWHKLTKKCITLLKTQFKNLEMMNMYVFVYVYV